MHYTQITRLPVETLLSKLSMNEEDQSWPCSCQIVDKKTNILLKDGPNDISRSWSSQYMKELLSFSLY